jgi:signal transduction histidine kinase
VNEELRAHAELEQLRAMIERLPSGVLTVDRDLTVSDANAAARRLFDPEPLRIGQPLPQLWFVPHLPTFVHGLFKRDHGPARYEVRPDAEHAFTVTGVPAGHAQTVLLIIDDVLVDERRAGAEREFIANAAHELLTPLTGIVGAAHALESGAKLEPELRDRFITHITRECNRLARIARGLLVLARAQSGQEPPRPDVVELGPLLEQAAEGAGSTGDVAISCPSDLTVFVDRDLAEQAFTNLIANARRHSGNAPVTVTAYATDDENAAIEISDEGPGFEPDGELGRRFSSGEGREGRGFGLGLSIATQALNACGGELTLRPRADQGTVALIELPRGTREHA